MGKTNFTFVRPMSWAASLLVMAFMFVAQATYAQSCGCQDQVNVTLGADCTLDLTLDMVGAGDCSGADRVIVNDGDANNGATIDCPGLYTYGIFDASNNLICWGEVLAEDKSAPEFEAEVDIKGDPIECIYIDDLLNNASSIDPTHPLYIGYVTFTDNCEDCGCDVDVKFFDNVVYEACPSSTDFGDEYFNATLTRKFTATDCNGYTTDYSVTYDFYRPGLDDLTDPGDTDVQTCDAASEGYECPMPYWVGCFDLDGDSSNDLIYLDDLDCNYSVTTDVTEFPVCGGSGIKYECVITVFDWCAGESQEIKTYISKYTDALGPDFTGAAIDGEIGEMSDAPSGAIAEVSTGPADCTAAFSTTLESLKAQFSFDLDDCDIAEYSVTIWSYGPEYVHGIPTGDTIWREENFPVIGSVTAGIPVGQYAIDIEAFDGCYNSSSGYVYFEVVDPIAPVMKCDDDLNVTLSTGGYAKVYADDIDEGSWDNCALAGIDVRRETSSGYSAWGDYVEFGCDDLGAPVIVELRGTDASGNTNICWMDLTIEDKVEPICADLAPVETYCDDENLADLTSFGLPATPFSNCSNITIEELAAIVDLDNCGFGTITRQYEAVKNAGTANEVRSATCEQVITVVANYQYWIKFPADQSASCGDNVSIVGVSFEENGCDLLAVSTTDERFYATQDPNACYKIFRTYSVINWCEYDGEALPTVVGRDWDGLNGTNPSAPSGDGNPGDEDMYVIVERNMSDAEADRVVYYDNDADPSVGNGSVPNGLTVADYWWRVTEDDDAWGNNDNDQGNDAADDDDTRYGSFGYWQYTQHIVVYDDVDPELTVTGEDSFCSISSDLTKCDGPVEFAISATDACTDDTDDVTITVGLDVGNTGAVDADATANLVGGVFSATYPQGTHRLVITANDGCGNFTTTEKVFSVVDCKSPAPICINGLSIELMPSEVDSTGAAMAVWASDFLASPIYDCNGQGTDGEVTKFSMNRAGGEVDSDQTGVTFNCLDAGSVVEVEVYAWDAVGNGDFCLTTVQVDDNMGSCSSDESGGVAGAIATESSASVEGVEVQLSGARSMMYMTDANGSFDFAGLQMGHDYTVTPQLDRHALNGVSTFDLVLISKHILGVDALDSPYKVIAADVNNSKSVSTLDLIHLRKLILNIDTEFSNNTSWRFVDASYNFNNPANPLAESFAEVKNINNLDGEEEVDFVAIKVGDVNGSANVAEVRSLAGTFHLNVAEQALKAGNEYTIDIDAADLNAVQGYQFTMNVVNAEIVDVVAGIASEENFGVFAKEGVITTSWNGEATAGTLFSVVVRATADVNVSEVLSVGSRYTAAEAYNTADEVMGVALNINGTEATAANALFQNNPNPFQGETVIGFNLIDASEATITLQDVTGRILKVVEGDFNAGYNQVRLTATDLPSTGVFYYTLEAGEFTATKKMIVVE